MHTKIALNSAWVPNNDSYLCNIFLHNCPNVLCGWKCGRLMCRFYTVCFALMYDDRAKHRTHHHWKCCTRLFRSYSLLRKWTFNLSPLVHLRRLFLSIRSSPFKVAIKIGQYGKQQADKLCALYHAGLWNFIKRCCNCLFQTTWAL